MKSISNEKVAWVFHGVSLNWFVDANARCLVKPGASLTGA